MGDCKSGTMSTIKKVKRSGRIRSTGVVGRSYYEQACESNDNKNESSEEKWRRSGVVFSRCLLL
jgi:hypothetical protein